ncbi:MAG: Rieske 2Fe-2S domain-containing protein, partial [Acidimicrobiia bacterium]
GKVTVGSVADIQAAIDNKIPFYNASAKAYVVAYPKDDLAKAKKVPAYAQLIPGMEEGFVAHYQKCVHLGCRVPWCASSQWFECPCHGSKYNRVGEKQGGPAPRGLDHFPLEVSGGDVTLDTGIIVIGAPIGTDTTGQSPEGAPCV